MEDVLPYILSLNKYKAKYSLVCKDWDRLYIKALEIYNIKIKLYGIKDKEFIEFTNLHRFRKIRSLKINVSTELTVVHLTFVNLKFLCIKNCLKISEIKIDSLKTLESLNITCCGNITLIPNFTNLKKLKIMSCYNIENIPDSFSTLTQLKCDIKMLGIDLSNFSNIKELYSYTGTNFNKISKYSNITKSVEILVLRSISFGYNYALDNFHNLKKLILVNCTLDRLPNKSGYSNIEKLIVKNNRLKLKLPDFNRLKTLVLKRGKINKLPISSINTLEKLHIINSEITEIHNFTKIKDLRLSMVNIKEIPISLVDTLEKVYISNCEILTKLPNFNNLIMFIVYDSGEIMPDVINNSKLSRYYYSDSFTEIAEQSTNKSKKYKK